MLIFAQIVGLGVVLEPRQLDLAPGTAISQECKFKTAIAGWLAPLNLKTQCFSIKTNRRFQIAHIQIGVDIGEIHPRCLLKSGMILFYHARLKRNVSKSWMMATSKACFTSTFRGGVCIRCQVQKTDRTMT